MLTKKQLTAIASLVMVLGMCLRCINLDGKPYWVDEAVTAFRVTGHTYNESIDAVSSSIVTASEVRQLLQLSPSKTWRDTFKSLNRQFVHPPLYFLLLRGWVGIVGDSPAKFRSFSVLLSFLTFPALYWLCCNLFGNTRIIWIVLALYAISPIQVKFAQIARPYTFIIFSNVLSSAVLAWAVSSSQKHFRNRSTAWATYLFASSLTLYSSITGLFIIAAHCIWLLITKCYRVLPQFIIAAGTAFTLFLPWLLYVHRNWYYVQIATRNMRTSLPITSYFKSWIANLSYAFVDIGLSSNLSFSIILGILILSLTIIATNAFLRSGHPWATIFIIVLMIVPFIGLLLRDFTLGGRTSGTDRLVMFPLLIILIIIGFYLQDLITSERRCKQIKGIALSSFLAFLGVFSSIILISDPYWPYGAAEYIEYNLNISKIINSTENPIVVTEDTRRDFNDMLILAGAIRRNTHFAAYNLVQSGLPNGYTDYFFPYSTTQTISELKDKGYDLDLVYSHENSKLWHYKVESN